MRCFRAKGNDCAIKQQGSFVSTDCFLSRDLGYAMELLGYTIASQVLFLSICPAAVFSKIRTFSWYEHSWGCRDNGEIVGSSEICVGKALG